MTPKQALIRLEKVALALEDARMDLEDFLLELHESDHWEALSYADLGGALCCSRQAAHERVTRLLDSGSRRKFRRPMVHPDQLTIGE